MKTLLYFFLISLIGITSFSCTRTQSQAEKEEEIARMTGYSIEPKRPAELPVNAKWQGSIDSHGSWFLIDKPSGLPQNEYRLTKYGYSDIKNDIRFKAIFKKETADNFYLDKGYEFTYPTNYELCTIIQDGKKIKFSLVKDWKK